MGTHNHVMQRLRKMRVGFVNGEAVTCTKRSLQTFISRARAKVRAGEWPAFDWDYDLIEGDADDQVLYVWKEKKRIRK